MKQSIEIIQELIEDESERECISFLWWLKVNSEALEDFKKEKMCAMDIFESYKNGKKYDLLKIKSERNQMPDVYTTL